MHTFVNWAVAFAQSHALLAYGLALILAAAESLPVIGTVVPGSAVIIAFGTLIAAGALLFWPFLASVTLGAILGDGFAYWLGLRYHEALLQRWPLSRHPEIAARGEAVFARHGGKSVFIARFTPGVRAIVPMLAGVLRMPGLRFLAFNIASAIVWALSHVLFGVALGATLELLGAVAGRLAVLVGLIIVLTYVVIWLSRWAVRQLPNILSRGADMLRQWAARNPGWLARQAHRALATDRAQALGLGFMATLLVAGIWLLLGAVQDLLSGDPLVRADGVVQQALMSLRMAEGDYVMLIMAAPGSFQVLALIGIGVTLILAILRQWPWLFAWLLGLAGAGGLGLLLHLLNNQPAVASGIWSSANTLLGPTAYGLLGLFFSQAVTTRWRPVIVSVFALFVVFGATARLYLGLSLLSTEVIAIAFALGWVGLVGLVALSRRLPTFPNVPFAVLALPVLAGAMALQAGGYPLIQPPPIVMAPVQQMTFSSWQAAGWDALPDSRIGLLGNYTHPFTLQWAGSVAELTQALQPQGWHTPVPWTARNTISWLAPLGQPTELPVLPHYANGRPQALVLVHAVSGNVRLVLRLWSANAEITNGTHLLPLWLGTIDTEKFTRIAGVLTITHAAPADQQTFSTLATSLPGARSVTETSVPGLGSRPQDSSAAVLLGWTTTP